jgi:hypothetical protein
VKRPRGAANSTPALTVRPLWSSMGGTRAVMMVCIAAHTPTDQADGRLSPCGWYKLAVIQMPLGAFIAILNFRLLVCVRISPVLPSGRFHTDAHLPRFSVNLHLTHLQKTFNSMDCGKNYLGSVSSFLNDASKFKD